MADADQVPILPTERDPRLITIRRGGTLSDAHHRQLAAWAIACAEHVLPLFERAAPDDRRPHEALAIARAWISGSATMTAAHQAAFLANSAAKGLHDPAKFAALSAGQATAVAHVAAHDLGAAAYAIRAAVAAGSAPDSTRIRAAERAWQLRRVPDELRDLVIDDMRARSSICWNVFDDGPPSN